jgi:serine/threonine-protein kinase
MVTNEDNVKILDFGLAKDYKEGIDLTTLSGAINTDNMSPEIKDSIKNYSVKSDIYSIGCIMFRILTNKAIHIDYIEDLKKVSVPDKIIKVIKKCTAISLEERYNTCQEIYEDLDNLTILEENSG